MYAPRDKWRFAWPLGSRWRDLVVTITMSDASKAKNARPGETGRFYVHRCGIDEPLELLICAGRNCASRLDVVSRRLPFQRGLDQALALVVAGPQDLGQEVIVSLPIENESRVWIPEVTPNRHRHFCHPAFSRLILYLDHRVRDQAHCVCTRWKAAGEATKS